MSDLVEFLEFLRARLDEDEQAARAAEGGPWEALQRYENAQWEVTSEKRPIVFLGYEGDGGIDTPDDAQHIARHDPARILREVEAKRQMIHIHGQPHECLALTGSGERSAVDGKPWELWEPAHTDNHGPCLVLRLLALPYADHPDYREEWRP